MSIVFFFLQVVHIDLISVWVIEFDFSVGMKLTWLLRGWSKLDCSLYARRRSHHSSVSMHIGLVCVCMVQIDFAFSVGDRIWLDSNVGWYRFDWCVGCRNWLDFSLGDRRWLDFSDGIEITLVCAGIDIYLVLASDQTWLIFRAGVKVDLGFVAGRKLLGCDVMLLLLLL